MSVPQNVKELAAIFGKVVLPWEQGFPMPKGKVGNWILDYDPKNETFLIREVADTAGNFRYPFGDFSIESNEFYTAVNMMVRALNEYRRLYPLPQGVRHEIPPGEIYGAHLPQVTIKGTTYYRDDVKKEFRVVGHPEQRISFENYEQKYFGRNRWIRANFSGNVAKMQSNRAEAYQTTSQDNAIQALSFWILNGVLLPGAAPEKDPQRPGRGEGNWLEIEKVNGKINIADNHNQNLSTEDAQKAIRAVRSWVYGGQLKG